MKKLLISTVAAIALMVSPVLAQTPPTPNIPALLDKATDDVLVEGLDMLSVCIATDLSVIHRIEGLMKAEEDEPTQDSHKKLDEMLTDAKALMLASEMQSDAGGMILDVLINKKHHKVDELNTHIEGVISQTKDDLDTTFKDVSDYRDLTGKFGPKLKHCNDARHTWFKKLTKTGSDS